jgi:tRNA-2-methylthio-N6-dimethylallyladenosine synthase
MAVLLERRGKRAGQLVGRSPYMQAVHVTAPERFLGRIVQVRIGAGHANSLAGSLLEPADPPVPGTANAGNPDRARAMA